MRRALRLATTEVAAQYETSEQDRIDMATAIFILMLAHARGEALDSKLVTKLEEYGVTADQLDAVAETVSRETAAKMFGLRWNGVDFVDDPAGKSITDTTDAAVNRTVEKAIEEDWDEDELTVALAALVVFGSTRADMISEDQLYDLGNAMQLGAMEAAGVFEVDVKDAQGPQGGDTDEPCIEADGSRWPIIFAKRNLKQHPFCTRTFSAVWPVKAK